MPPSRSTTSGGSDPRTATTLIVFEEYVPLEYRQQLAITSSSRRRLPSLFSPYGKKHWKQAPTLNGRPYVLGHVPTSPTYREVEFEGLLHGTAATKVITLSKTPRVQSTVSNAPVAEAPPPPVPVLTKRFSGPLKVPQFEIPPTVKSDDIESDPTASPAIKKRFRLPTTPGSNRKSMMPAEYSTVEFETRMASYSDDEHNGSLHEPEDVKQKRRESRADAWVDILVGSQPRRIGDQDAEVPDRRREPQSRRSDPNLASLEVAQVLATVQNRSPSPPSMMERVDRDYGMDHHVQDLDVDEGETVPRSSGAHSIGTDDSVVLAYQEPETADFDNLDPSQTVLTSRQLAKHQRRIGYFDLHPDRRQLPRPSLSDEDPRAKLADDSDDDDDDDDERVYGPPETIRPLPIPPIPQVQPRVLPSLDPIPTLIPPTAEVKEKRPLTPPDISSGNGSSIAPSTPSKTAALIEMYRERERGSPASPASNVPAVPIIIAPLAPSRLPVRSASLPKEGAPLFQPSLPSTASPKVSPKLSPPESTCIDLPRIQLEETGRSSPARYVHGAPLHNVLEEEEE